jgi:hypothetical protein
MKFWQPYGESEDSALEAIDTADSSKLTESLNSLASTAKELESHGPVADLVMDGVAVESLQNTCGVSGTCAIGAAGKVKRRQFVWRAAPYLEG